MRKSLLAITMGDPAGVGPETIVGAWADDEVHRCARLLAIGHPKIFRRAARLLNRAIEVVEIGSAEEAKSTATLLPCLRTGDDSALSVPAATVDSRSGEAAYQAIVRAAELALTGKIDGLVTAPIHKAALWKAGHRYPGHTELLAEICGVTDFAMMLYLVGGGEENGDRLAARRHTVGVVHVTLHMALRDVFSRITTDAVLAKARLVTDLMARISGRPPRIAVCALNPHAGEDGLFGDEEQRIIGPAVEHGRSEGMDITGPLPADTLMVRARDGDFDAVVAMYHDQGHIAIKLMGMHRAVNVTLGLPIIRTSVAHGTAFDLAWQGRAETSSMVEAIRLAAKFVTSGS
jgi:4-hydroxythreonine-4-phosphate dehydrogenase